MLSHQMRWTILALSVVGSVANAADQPLQVEANRLRNVLADRAGSVRKMEVRLKDRSVNKGKLLSAEEQGLKLRAKDAASGDQVIPYDQISTIRLDLGASRGWQITGGIVGALVGGQVGWFASESSDTTARNVGLIGLGAGAFVGTKLGGLHRKILVIEVK